MTTDHLGEESYETYGPPPAQAPDSLPNVRLLPLGFIAIYAFLVGMFVKKAVSLVGMIFVAEIILIASLPFLIYVSGAKLFQNKNFRWLATFNIILLVGYIISDLFAGSTFHNMMRGWARIIFLFMDFVALSCLFCWAKRSILWYCIGLSLGYLSFVQSWGKFDTAWKFTYGPAFIYFTSAIAPKISKFIGGAAIISVGILIMFNGARSLGASVLLAGALSLLKSRNSSANMAQMAKTLVIGLLAIGILAIIYNLSIDYITQFRKLSDEGRLTGLEEAMSSVMSSPIIGRGSWGFMHGAQSQLTQDQMAVSGGHSYILQSWVEGGILSASFFMYLLFKLIQGMLYALGRRPYDNLCPLIFFVFIFTVWNIFMSPFGGAHRFHIALPMALLCLMQHEKLYPEQDTKTV